MTLTRTFLTPVGRMLLILSNFILVSSVFSFLIFFPLGSFIIPTYDMACHSHLTHAYVFSSISPHVSHILHRYLMCNPCAQLVLCQVLYL